MFKKIIYSFCIVFAPLSLLLAESGMVPDVGSPLVPLDIKMVRLFYVISIGWAILSLLIGFCQKKNVFNGWLIALLFSVFGFILKSIYGVYLNSLLISHLPLLGPNGENSNLAISDIAVYARCYLWCEICFLVPIFISMLMIVRIVMKKNKEASDIESSAFNDNA